MRRFWTRWRWPILLVVILVGVLAAAPGALASTVPRMHQTHPMGAQPLDQLSGDAFDQEFLTQMTMHHAMGVMMTQPVVTGGAHQELKDLGGQMIADQSREIEQMRGEYARLYYLAEGMAFDATQAEVLKVRTNLRERLAKKQQRIERLKAKLGS